MVEPDPLSYPHPLLTIRPWWRTSLGLVVVLGLLALISAVIPLWRDVEPIVVRSVLSLNGSDWIAPRDFKGEVGITRSAEDSPLELMPVQDSPEDRDPSVGADTPKRVNVFGAIICGILISFGLIAIGLLIYAGA